MSKNRVIMYGAFGAFVLFGFYMMIAGPDSIDNTSAVNDDDSEALSALFGGGQSNNGAASARDGGDYSVFQSDMWEAGVGETPIDSSASDDSDGSGILDPVSEGNPVNPQTGTPYTDAMMKQFDKLHEKFPGNSIIPTRKTPEMVEQERLEKLELNEIRARMNTGNASAGDVNQYYDSKTKMVKDRLELINYVMESQGDKMSDDIREQYKKVLEMNNKQLDSYNKSRERDLKKSSGS